MRAGRAPATMEGLASTSSGTTSQGSRDPGQPQTSRSRDPVEIVTTPRRGALRVSEPPRHPFAARSQQWDEHLQRRRILLFSRRYTRALRRCPRHDSAAALLTPHTRPMSASMKQMPPELVDAPEQSTPAKTPKNYRGFVAGVFSGVAKLSGTSPASHRTPVRDLKLIPRSGAPVRYHKGPTADHRPFALPRTAGLSDADTAK